MMMMMMVVVMMVIVSVMGVKQKKQIGENSKVKVGL